SKYDCTIAFAHRTVVAPRSSGSGGENTSELREQRQDDHKPDAKCAEWCNQRKGRIEGSIRNDVGDFIEINPEHAFLTELARQHAVRSVERHAHDEPRRD